MNRLMSFSRWMFPSTGPLLQGCCEATIRITLVVFHVGTAFIVPDSYFACKPRWMSALTCWQQLNLQTQCCGGMAERLSFFG
jgi:hypothetical protein